MKKDTSMAEKKTTKSKEKKKGRKNVATLEEEEKTLEEAKDKRATCKKKIQILDNKLKSAHLDAEKKKRYTDLHGQATKRLKEIKKDITRIQGRIRNKRKKKKKQVQSTLDATVAETTSKKRPRDPEVQKPQKQKKTDKEEDQDVLMLCGYNAMILDEAKQESDEDFRKALEVVVTQKSRDQWKHVLRQLVIHFTRAIEDEIGHPDEKPHQDLGLATLLVVVLRLLVDAKRVWTKEVSTSELEDTPISLFNNAPIKIKKQTVVKKIVIQDSSDDTYTYYYCSSKEKLAVALQNTFCPTEGLSHDMIQAGFLTSLIILKRYRVQVRKAAAKQKKE
jgi:hypothetical protein